MNAPTRTAGATRGSVWARLLAAFLLAFPTAGCCLFGPGPPPPPLPMADVIEAVRTQSETFQTVVDGDISLSVTVTDAKGKRDKQPTLGGALAFDAKVPALWLYTEKLTRDVFTLWASGSRFYLLNHDNGKVGTGTQAAYAKFPELIRPEEVRSYFAGPETLGLCWPDVQMVIEPDDYCFDVRVSGLLQKQVYVDRRKVVLSGIRLYDAFGRMETELRLDRYKRVGDDGPLFRRLRLDRPLVGVLIELHLGDPKLNKPLSEATFEPKYPPGSEVIDLDRPGTSAAELFEEED